MIWLFCATDRWRVHFICKFKIPDMNKVRLERLNNLPLSLVVTPEANNYPLYILVK
jgi:hypothetical protein